MKQELASGHAREAVKFRGVTAVPLSASVDGGQHFVLNGAEWLVRSHWSRDQFACVRHSERVKAERDNACDELIHHRMSVGKSNRDAPWHQPPPIPVANQLG